MEEIIRTTKTHSFTLFEMSTFVANVAEKYLKGNSLPWENIAYLTPFDKGQHQISIILLDVNLLIEYGGINIHLDDDSSKYAVIHGLRVFPQARQNKYATLLMKTAEAVISKLEFDGIKLQALTDTWIVNWYKRLGYQEDVFQSEGGVQLYKELNNNN